MLNIRRTLQMTSLLFGMVVLFCYIAWHLGYDGFVLFGHIALPIWLTNIVCAILLCINLSLLAGFVLDLYSWKVLYFSISVTIITVIAERFFPAGVFNGLFSTFILLIAVVLTKRGRWALLRLGIALAITLTHQLITSMISVVDLTVYISIYQMFRLSLDAIILMLLLYSIGGVKHNDRHSNRKLELVVFPGRVRDDRVGDESRQSNSKSTRDLPVGKFELWVMRSVIAAVQILQWMFILWVCNLDNLFLDALVMTTSFICHGMIIAKRKHFKPIILCTLVATAMFYFAARFTISFQYSHFFPIVVGLLLAYTVYRISYQLERAAKEKARADLERIKKLEAQMSEAWKHIDKLS